MAKKLTKKERDLMRLKKWRAAHAHDTAWRAEQKARARARVASLQADAAYGRKVRETLQAISKIFQEVNRLIDGMTSEGVAR